MSELSASMVGDVLARTALFASLDPGECAALATACTQHRYAKGEFLVQQGAPGDRLLVLAQGRVKVMVSSAQGDEVVLATLTSPATFGELAILDGAERSASVVALEPVLVLALGRRPLLTLMGEHPAVLSAVLTGLGAVVRRLTDTTADLVFLDLGGRLAKVLLRLAHEGDSDAPPGRAPVVRLTQSELAAAVGASRQATNRTLSIMAGQGWIEMTGTAISLRDVPALRRRAGQ